jgi:hypothetical protein
MRDMHLLHVIAMHLTHCAGGSGADMIHRLACWTATPWLAAVHCKHHVAASPKAMTQSRCCMAHACDAHVHSSPCMAHNAWRCCWQGTALQREACFCRRQTVALALRAACSGQFACCWQAHVLDSISVIR